MGDLSMKKLEEFSKFFWKMSSGLNLSNPANTPAPATPLKMFAPAPFIRDMKTLILDDLDETIHGSLVLDSTSGGHHHAPPDGVNGVGHETSCYCDSPSQEEGNANASIFSQQKRLECVIEAKVHATIDEDTNSRDGEPSVQTLDTVRLQCLDVDINETIELTLTTLTLGIVSQPGPCVI